MENKLVHPSPSTTLGLAYIEASMDQKLQDLDLEVKTLGHAPNTESVHAPTGEKLLLDESSGQVIADHLKIPELAMEIKRAVWQIKRSLRAKQELQEEKRDIEGATKKDS